MKKRLRMLCALLAAALLLPVMAGAAEVPAFTAAQRLINAGIADGTADGFRGSDNITLGEIAVMLNRIVTFEDRLVRSFSDIDANSEEGDAILRLAKAGILYVPPEGDLCYPNSYISRQDVVAMLYKLFQMKPEGSAPGWTDYSYIVNTDAANTFYSKGYIPQSMQMGNCFAPNMGIKRGEFAQLLCSLVACFADSESYDGTISGNAVVRELNPGLSATGVIYVTGESGNDTASVVYLQDKWSASRVASAEYTQLIGTCTTSFPAGVSGRNTNVKTAAEGYVSGTLIAPGETFSFNNVVGQRTSAKGFKEAKIFIGTGTAMGLGGGVCQVSSTIFVAALNAGMTITERHQHSMEVTYIDKGLDATVSFGALDMQFRNDIDVPVKITCSADTEAGILTVNFWTAADYQKPKTVVGASHKGVYYYGYRYINGSLDWYTTSKYSQGA